MRSGHRISQGGSSHQVEGQGQVYLAVYPLVLKELEFWERGSLAVKASCSPQSLPILAYSSGRSHAQIPAPAREGEKDITGRVIQDLSSNQKRQITQHLKK